MIKRNIKTAGFSLIELLFAMLFLSVIVFGVIRLQTSNLTLSNTKQLELKAYSYAGQALEVVSALGKSALSTCTSPCFLKHSGNYSLDDTTQETLDSGLFERTIEFNSTDLTDAYLVTAVVKWTDSSGEHTISAKRVIF